MEKQCAALSACVVVAGSSYHFYFVSQASKLDLKMGSIWISPITNNQNPKS